MNVEAHRAMEERIFSKYPEIFKQRNLSMDQTCMCWGLECGVGWEKLLDNLCESITYYCKIADLPLPQASQVKEKFGTLRFYWQWWFDEGQKQATNQDHAIIDALIDCAENKSEYTCEECGRHGELDTNGWWKVRCRQCKETKETNSAPSSGS